ncbi:MAG: ribulose-phosphate 3-epimerase [Chitinophagales bacterium]|jgi:ribulose-phosphate 3-epimerase|nr:ribulose-phosphate 3-epimerase [Chitinophagales bacterium]
MNAIIAPSILSADFGNLKDAVTMINESAADWIHCDIMDGRFVPNISFGFPVLKAIKKAALKPLDIHLMIMEPEKYISELHVLGADIVSVHLEASPHLHRTVSSLKEKGIKAGVAINPHTAIMFLEDLITDIDLVCLMSVNPGFGGQKFIEHTYNKIYQLKNLILSKNSRAKIEVDGGVDVSNAGRLLDSGADVLVAGNAIFNSENPHATIELLKKTSRNLSEV